MRSRSIQEYFFFGTCVRYLQDARKGWPIGDAPGQGARLRTNLRLLFQYLEDLELIVTSRHVACSRLRDLLAELEKVEEGSLLTEEQAQKLGKWVPSIRDSVDAELLGMHSYSVTPKRLDVNHLVGDVDGLFAPGVFQKLPEIARHGLTEAGRCIAFALPTAAAFHILRATESILRAYYKTLVKKGGKATMWGPIIADLRQRRAAKNESVLLNHLDNIRLSFRNPTQHPEKIYDIDEVQDLWSLCVDAINRMATKL